MYLEDECLGGGVISERHWAKFLNQSPGSSFSQNFVSPLDKAQFSLSEISTCPNAGSTSLLAATQGSIPQVGSSPFFRSSRNRFSFTLRASTSSSSTTTSESSSVSQKHSFALWWPLVSHVVGAWIAALTLVSWEDVQCRSLACRQQSAIAASWGQATVQSLSYSEHVPKRQSTRPIFAPSSLPLPSTAQQGAAIHTLLECLLSLSKIRVAAEDYQWTTVREELQSWKNAVEEAANALRPVDPAVGFGWTSCAWRHCDALADWQEAVAELDTLTGVLEPFEVIFCLDIIERSLRDMLAQAPWDIASQADKLAWQTMPPYAPHRLFDPPNDPDHPTSLQEAEEELKLDQDFLDTIKALRIVDEDG